nr:MAG TPA: hypothetical protein [Caudoviricetes sp.]
MLVKHIITPLINVLPLMFKYNRNKDIIIKI